MWFQAVVALLLLLILFNLGSAMVYLLKDRSATRRSLKALTWRIGLSVLLFVLLLVGFAAGWIQPHSAIPLPK